MGAAKRLEIVSLRVLTIGDKKITYLTFIPDELFLVIACGLCVHKRMSRGAKIELGQRNYLTKIVCEFTR